MTQEKDDEREIAGLTKIVSSLPVDHSGTTVHLKGWRLEASERHPLVIVHDLGEQADLYRKTAEAFVANGYSSYAFDLRGHGRSGRRLGHAPSFNVLVKDLLQVAAWVRHKEGGRSPIILELTSNVGIFPRILLRILAEISPTFRIPASLSPRFAKDLRIRRPDDGDADQGRVVWFPRLTAVFAHELLSAIKRAEARFIEYHGSVLILCPEKDHVASYHNLKKSAAIHDEHNLQIAELLGCSHHVFTEHETDRAAALGVIFPWLEERINAESRQESASAAEIRLRGASRADYRDTPQEAEKPGATKD